MSKSDAPKSAFEIAMEKLNAKDREEGQAPPKALSDEQKERIQQARAEGKAKLAELEILKAGRMAEAGGDPARLSEVKQEIEIDRRRIEDEVERKVKAIKSE